MELAQAAPRAAGRLGLGLWAKWARTFKGLLGVITVVGTCERCFPAVGDTSLWVHARFVKRVQVIDTLGSLNGSKSLIFGFSFVWLFYIIVYMMGANRAANEAH